MEFLIIMQCLIVNVYGTNRSRGSTDSVSYQISGSHMLTCRIELNSKLIMYNRFMSYISFHIIFIVDSVVHDTYECDGDLMLGS